MGQEFKKIGARFDFRLRAPLKSGFSLRISLLFLSKLRKLGTVLNLAQTGMAHLVQYAPIYDDHFHILKFVALKSVTTSMLLWQVDLVNDRLESNHVPW